MTIESSGALAGSQVDADTVDGQHASATPAASKLLSLDASSNFPISVIADGAIVATKLATDAVETLKIKDANVTAAKLATDAVETAKIKDANVTLPKLEASLQKEIVTLCMSFETGEQTATKVFFPYKVTVNKIRGIVTKAIAATDNGTIQGANSTGDSASGLITATASDAVNTEYSVSPTTNNVVLADGYYKLTSAKSTAGGKVLVTLEVTRTA